MGKANIGKLLVESTLIQSLHDIMNRLAFCIHQKRVPKVFHYGIPVNAGSLLSRGEEYNSWTWAVVSDEIVSLHEYILLM